MRYLFGGTESVDNHGLAVDAVDLDLVVLRQDAALDPAPPRRLYQSNGFVLYQKKLQK